VSSVVKTVQKQANFSLKSDKTEILIINYSMYR
jgi:hypothetical protein